MFYVENNKNNKHPLLSCRNQDVSLSEWSWYCISRYKIVSIFQVSVFFFFPIPHLSQVVARVIGRQVVLQII